MSSEEPNQTTGSPSTEDQDGYDSEYEELPPMSAETDGDNTDINTNISNGKVWMSDKRYSFNVSNPVSLQRIPYTRIYEPSKPFSDPKNRWLVPHCPVRVKIVNAEHRTGTHILNPYLYTIEVQHFHYKWTIKRRHNHFQHLHQQLLLFRHTLRLPLPLKRHREMRKTIGPKNRKSVPKFPRRPEAFILSEESLEERKVCSIRF